MHISQLDEQQVQSFGSQHCMHYSLAEDQKMLVLSGVVTLDYRCPGWSNETMVSGWFEQTLSLDIALPADFLKEGETFLINQAVPFLSLNAIDGSTNVGWGVKSFQLAPGQMVRDHVPLQAELAVSRSGEVLRQVGYHISLLGRVVR